MVTITSLARIFPFAAGAKRSAFEATLHDAFESATQRRQITRQKHVFFRIGLLLPLLTLPLRADPHPWTHEDLRAALPFASAPRPAPDSLWSVAYARLVVSDAEHIVTAPLRWSQKDWWLAGGLAGVAVTASSMDRQIKQESQEDRSHRLDATTRQVQRFGSEYSWVVLAGFEGYGYAADDPRARTVALDGLTSSIIASGLITPIVKIFAGRVRPNTSRRTFEFKPFSGNYSFPSGHATQAFALATVISAHYDQWWVQGLAYGLAAGVGYSRIEQDSHFASDVAAGAMIGTMVGRAVVELHRKTGNAATTVAPFLGGRTTGLFYRRDF